MQYSRRFMLLAGVASLAACSTSKFQRYNGPEVTHIVVAKQRRRMYLMNNQDTLQTYDVELGFAPEQHKFQEGDGRTPEGTYYIDRRNPNSRYHLSLGISYPNARDRARAHAAGVSPGGDIFIHGTPKMFAGQPDWTYGCIAITNREMEEVFAMVRTGTPIRILS